MLDIQASDFQAELPIYSRPIKFQATNTHTNVWVHRLSHKFCEPLKNGFYLVVYLFAVRRSACIEGKPLELMYVS